MSKVAGEIKMNKSLLFDFYQANQRYFVLAIEANINRMIPIVFSGVKDELVKELINQTKGRLINGFSGKMYQVTRTAITDFDNICDLYGNKPQIDVNLFDLRHLLLDLLEVMRTVAREDTGWTGAPA